MVSLSPSWMTQMFTQWSGLLVLKISTLLEDEFKKNRGGNLPHDAFRGEKDIALSLWQPVGLSIVVYNPNGLPKHILRRNNHRCAQSQDLWLEPNLSESTTGLRRILPFLWQRWDWSQSASVEAGLGLAQARQRWRILLLPQGGSKWWTLQCYALLRFEIMMMRMVTRMILREEMI